MAKRVDKKTILIYSLVFSPDGVSTAHLYNDLVLGFKKKKGYKVTVLTSTPHYNITNESLITQPLKKVFWLFYIQVFLMD